MQGNSVAVLSNEVYCPKPCFKAGPNIGIWYSEELSYL